MFRIEVGENKEKVFQIEGEKMKKIVFQIEVGGKEEKDEGCLFLY